jgi:hypothetical protein
VRRSELGYKNQPHPKYSLLGVYYVPGTGLFSLPHLILKIVFRQESFPGTGEKFNFQID